MRIVKIQAALLLLLVAGCGGSKTYPVLGKVVYADGSAATNLVGCQVEFEAVDAKVDGKGVSAVGTITEQGTFQLTTFKENDGAMEGKHRVLISNPAAVDDTPRVPRVLHARYGSYLTSKLEVNIEAKRNEVTLMIERLGK